MYDGNNLVFERGIGADGKTLVKNYIWAFGKLTARVDYTQAEDGQLTEVRRLYYTTDQIGSVRLVTDAQGAKVWEGEFDSFGNLLAEELYDSGYEAEYWFGGKRYDEDVKLFYFNARWYDAANGRFVSEDPALSGNNWYVYCANNPLVMTDTSGKVANSIIGAGVGAAAGFLSSLIENFFNKKSFEKKLLNIGCETVGSAITGTLCANGISPVIAGAVGDAVSAFVDNTVAAFVIDGKDATPATIAGIVLNTCISAGLGGIGGRTGEAAMDQLEYAFSSVFSNFDAQQVGIIVSTIVVDGIINAIANKAGNSVDLIEIFENACNNYLKQANAPLPTPARITRPKITSTGNPLPTPIPTPAPNSAPNPVATPKSNSAQATNQTVTQTQVAGPNPKPTVKFQVTL